MRRPALALVAATAALALAGPSVAHVDGLAPASAQAAKEKRGCDPNYRGRCLKLNDSDYDCPGGSGNGPYYVRAPNGVVGNDRYRLDADGDGIACER